MFPAPIDRYVRPQTVADAIAALDGYDEGEAIFLAGGQSIMQAIKARMLRPACVIDLQAIPELGGFAFDPAGTRIGAMTRYAAIAEADTGPALAALGDAAAHVGDRQVRNRGTIGGSVCWNYVASCMPAVVLALNGRMELMAANGSTREVAAEDFFLGPLETAREENEMLIALHFDARNPRRGSAYQKWGLVTDSLPVVGVCVDIELDDAGVCTFARVSLSGLADGAQLAPTAAEALVGTKVTDDDIDAAMAAASDGSETQTDAWADEAYRHQLIRRVGRRVAQAARDRAQA